MNINKIAPTAAARVATRGSGRGKALNSSPSVGVVEEYSEVQFVQSESAVAIILPTAYLKYRQVMCNRIAKLDADHLQLQYSQAVVT